MSSEIASAVTGKIVEMVVNPIVNKVGSQFSYVFHYKRNIQTLDQQLDRLEARRGGMKLRIDAAERNLEVVDPSINEWLKEVDVIKSKVVAVHEGTSNVEKGYLNGWCPNLKHRYLLSRKARKLTRDIGELKGEGDKDAKFAYPAPPTGIIPSEGPSILPDDDGFKGFATRVVTMNEVMDALTDETINLIGISGIGGVGKTTLVNQVLKKVKAQSIFAEVAVTVVSQQLQLGKIQSEIAEQLGLNLKDGSSDARAELLRKRLEKGKRVLVVLDDIWEGTDLGKIGIPIGNDCKVLLTTRMERTCIEMAAQRHIKVEVLSEREAWNLFRETAGDCVEKAELCDIAKEVAKECGGLPIAVVTLAKALSDREKCKWHDTILQLKKSSRLEEKVQSSIMLSYNFLESRNPQAQPLLLQCTLFEEDADIPIEQLVKYSMGLDLFDDVETLEETRNRVHSLLNDLKSCNLLLEGDWWNRDLFVKLHDVVRDVCMLIASKPPHAYLSRHAEELKQWPQHNRHKLHTAIAIKSSAMKEFPGGLDYPNLRLLQLQLQLKNETTNIGGEFFQGMRGLQVLNFEAKGCNVLLPQSLGLLTNLQTLSLENCTLGGDLSSIGCVKGLKILSFNRSYLDDFPREVGELKNLKLLDLRCIFVGSSVNIESGLLSRLNQLEALYLGRYLFSETIKELNSLSCLTTLQISLSNSMILLELEEPFFEKLETFDIYIGWGGYYFGEYIKTNKITLEGGNLSCWVWHSKLRSLVRRTQSLYLDELDEGDSGFSALSDLEVLEIVRMDNLKEISPDSKVPEGSFRLLKVLRLRELRALKQLWRGPAQPPSLANLQELCIEKCLSIKSLFSPDVANCLVQLQDLEICSCKRLTGVVDDDAKGFQNIQFPKLKSILLTELRDFKSFYPESSNYEELEGDCGTIESLFNQWVSFPSLEDIDLKGAKSIKRIVGYQMQEGPANKLRKINISDCKKLKTFVDSTTLENLEEVQISECQSMKVVFGLEGLKIGEDSPFVFDTLQTVILSNLQSLAHVWKMVPDGIQGFQNLTTLKVDTCIKLRYLMSYSVAKMLLNLQVLILVKCRRIVGVVQGEDKAQSNECIVFPQLQKLELDDLERLTSFCSSKCSLVFPLLDKVIILDCPKMKSFCGGEVKAPVLKEPIEDPNGGKWFCEGNSIYRETRDVEVEVEVEDESETETETESCTSFEEEEEEDDDDVDEYDPNEYEYVYEYTYEYKNDDDDDDDEEEDDESDNIKNHDDDTNNTTNE